MTNDILKRNLRKTSQAVFFSILFIFSLTIYGQTDYYKSPNRKFVIVLDAGHGGKDPGNMGNGYIEKDIALEVVLEVGKALEKYDDIKVLYTRKTDVFVTLMGRADVANNADADLFVSVHCNSFGRSSQPHGTETFVLGTYRNEDNLKIAMKENSVIYLEDNYKVTYNGFDPQSPASYIGMTMMQARYLDQSILLAHNIQEEYDNALNRVNRGVKKAGFLVLRETYMPSVLTEIGFLTNNSEGRYLNSERGQDEIASAIVDGILEYKEALNLHATEVYREDDTAGEASKIYKGVTFQVQIAAGSKPLETAPYNFRGLKGVSRKKEGKLYKYYYGNSSNYTKIKNMLQEAQERGYKSAYIVAFKNGSKVEVSEVLKP